MYTFGVRRPKVWRIMSAILGLPRDAWGWHWGWPWKQLQTTTLHEPTCTNHRAQTDKRPDVTNIANMRARAGDRPLFTNRGVAVYTRFWSPLWIRQHRKHSYQAWQKSFEVAFGPAAGRLRWSSWLEQDWKHQSFLLGSKTLVVCCVIFLLFRIEST